MVYLGSKKWSRLLLTHLNVTGKVWANKLSNQKEIDMIPCFLFGVGVPNPDQSGCCPAQVTDLSWANREGLAKKANPEKKKWRP